MNTGPAMRAQTQITTHSMARLQERLHVVQPLGALQVLQGRLGDLTAHVGMEYDDEDGEFCAFKLMYFPEVQDFGVLVVKTVLESDGVPAFHVLKTVITQDMCVKKFARPIERRNYKRAAKLRLSPLEYRTWLHQTYGEREKPNDNQLNVVYRLGSQRKRIGVKIRPALCDGFKKNERIEDSLALSDTPSGAVENIAPDHFQHIPICRHHFPTPLPVACSAFSPMREFLPSNNSPRTSVSRSHGRAITLPRSDSLKNRFPARCQQRSAPVSSGYWSAWTREIPWS